ncbi:TauD/TfdA family dioxygenase [Staphylococcus epidermidis]|nr:TauD/TfdA family dioxygenase [Staphylococcus epidermidis]
MPSSLTIRPLGPRIGAEASQLDLSGQLSAQTLKAIEAALVQHEALVLHVPDMKPDQHLAIARHFGEPEVHTYYPNLGGSRADHADRFQAG